MSRPSCVVFLQTRWNAGGGAGLLAWPIPEHPGAYAFVEGGRFGVLLRCGGRSSAFRRGHLLLDSREVHIASEERAVMLEISCGDRSLMPAMPWLCYETLMLRGADGLWAPDEVRSHITAWMKLLRRGKDSDLAGLAGELMVMHGLVATHGIEAWGWWAGPRGSIHDIQASDRSIEVKATTSRTGWRVTMHGLFQPAPEGQNPLYLDFVRLEAVSNGGQSLSELLSGVPHGIFPESLRQELAAGGGLDTPRFRFLEGRRFLVDSDFPQIRTDHFETGMLPPRVVAIDYTVDLGGIPSTAFDLHG